MEPVVALTRDNIEGTLVVVLSFTIFAGSVYVLLSAVFGNKLGYLISATSLFAFMVILSALWVFGAPGTPKYLGPKGDLPAWVTLAAGQELTSSELQIDRYPSEPWQTSEEAKLVPEEEPAALAFAEFLAEEATAELARANMDGELGPEDFTIEDVRFHEVDETLIGAGTGFAAGGGRVVTVVGYKDPGNEPLPSYLFLAGSLIGLAAHLPFLDRAERERKAILTGGEQAGWRGPA